jgi:hypothetical protein
LTTALPPALPTGDYALTALLLLFAAGCASAAPLLLYGKSFVLLYGKSFALGISAIIVAILLFVAGINLPSSHLFSGSLIAVAVLVFLTTIISWSEIKRRAYNPKYRRAVITFIIISFGVYVITYMTSLRSDIDTYVIPRTISQKQADDLRDYLSQHEPHSVTVKVIPYYLSPSPNISPSPFDQEAVIFARQLFTALKNTNWQVTEDTSNKDPLPLNAGLCIQLWGNTAPFDAKHNPVALLQDAFAAAHVEVDCVGGGPASGDLFVLVGRRPLVLGDQEAVLSKIGRWIACQQSTSEQPRGFRIPC